MLLEYILAISLCLTTVVSTTKWNSFTLDVVSTTSKTKGSGDEAVNLIVEDEAFITAVQVGGQTLRLLIDTGSSDLWVASTLMEVGEIAAHGQRGLYNPDISSSWKAIDNEIFAITYGGGVEGAYGIVGTETIELANVTATEMPFGVATDIQNSFAYKPLLDDTFDGIMGLAFSSLNSIETTGRKSKPGPTFFDAVKAQLAMPVFATNFNLKSQAKSITFGSVNETLYSGPLGKVPIDNSYGYWQANNVTFSSNGKQLGTQQGIEFIMDTGSVGMMVDDQTAKDYYSLISGSRYDNETTVYSYPCNTSSLPDLEVHFTSGTSATMPGSTLNITAYPRRDGYCDGGVQPEKEFPRLSGFAFYTAYFTVWDPVTPEIRLAQYSGVDDTLAQHDGDLTPPTASTSTINTPTSTSSSSAAKKTGLQLMDVKTGLGTLALLAFI